MTQVTVTTRDGAVHTLECRDGLSLMENIRAHGLDELAALCGGNMSCGTCHVLVAPESLERLPAMSVDEGYLLELSPHREASSRLSCQVTVTQALAGLAVRIAPEDA